MKQVEGLSKKDARIILSIVGNRRAVSDRKDDPHDFRTYCKLCEEIETALGDYIDKVYEAVDRLQYAIADGMDEKRLTKLQSEINGAIRALDDTAANQQVILLLEDSVFSWFKGIWHGPGELDNSQETRRRVLRVDEALEHAQNVKARSVIESAPSSAASAD